MGKKKKSISFFSWALTGILSGGIRCLMHYFEVGNILPDAQGWCLGTVHVSFGALSEGQVVKVSSLISYWQRMSSKFQCLLSWLFYTSDLWIYWLRVRLSLSIIWLLLSRACWASTKFWVQFPPWNILIEDWSYSYSFEASVALVLGTAVIPEAEVHHIKCTGVLCYNCILFFVSVLNLLKGVILSSWVIGFDNFFSG